MAEEKVKKPEKKKPSNEEIQKLIDEGKITEKEADQKYGF